MGMYNEVFCRCPRCGMRAEMQISSIVPGFGEFDLNDLSTLSELSEDQLYELKERIASRHFKCHSCDNYFLSGDVESRRRSLAEELFHNFL